MRGAQIPHGWCLYKGGTFRCRTDGCRGKMTAGGRESAVSKPWREAWSSPPIPPEGTNLANTLTSDFCPSESWNKKCLLFSLLVCGALLWQHSKLMHWVLSKLEFLESISPVLAGKWQWLQDRATSYVRMKGGTWTCYSLPAGAKHVPPGSKAGGQAGDVSEDMFRSHSIVVWPQEPARLAAQNSALGWALQGEPAQWLPWVSESLQCLSKRQFLIPQQPHHRFQKVGWSEPVNSVPQMPGSRTQSKCTKLWGQPPFAAD